MAKSKKANTAANKENKYQQPVVTTESVMKKLQSASPLQASKVLIDMELYDQQSSLEVLDGIYKDFEKGSSVTDNLLNPLILNICDGLLSIDKLGLQKKGITASRLVNDINTFSYDEVSSTQKDQRIEKQNLNNNSKSHLDDKGKYVRDEIEDSTKKNNYTEEYFNGNTAVFSELEVNSDGEKKRIRKKGSDYNKNLQSKGKQTSTSSANNDHNLPLKMVFDEYGTSVALSKENLKEAANQKANFDVISEKINKIKLDESWTELKKKRDTLRGKDKLSSAEKKTLKNIENNITDSTFDNAIKREKEATKAVENHLNGSAFKNLTKDDKLIKKALNDTSNQVKNELKEQGLGELILLILKPISFEFKDIFQNGMLHSTGKTSKLSALMFRLKRATAYVLKNITNIGLGAIKDALSNFVKYLLNAIVDMFIGILKKAFKIIVEGFGAIMQAIRIMMGSSSPAQKADAITKLIATTVVTYIGFAFEETILGFINKLPFGDVLSQAVMVMFTGIASSVVVWMLDQADLFSVKDEMRAKRIGEIFDARIQQVKENTDAFETASIEKLAKDKLQFRSITEKMNNAIDNKQNVNDSVYDLADFMKIDLKIKSTDDFMDLLAEGNLAI